MPRIRCMAGSFVFASACESYRTAAGRADSEEEAWRLKQSHNLAGRASACAASPHCTPLHNPVACNAIESCQTGVHLHSRGRRHQWSTLSLHTCRRLPPPHPRVLQRTSCCVGRTTAILATSPRMPPAHNLVWLGEAPIISELRKQRH